MGIYAAARFISFLFFLAMASIQEENYWTKAQPGYFDFLNIWDVEWYERIFTGGYPTQLPQNLDGSVQQNNWAFYPVFPYLIRGLNLITIIEWKYLAPIVATIIGFFFIIMVYRLIRLTQSQSVSLWAVTLVSISMASPILQTGYAESLSLFLFAAALYCYLTKRWIWLATVLLALSITRPGLIAFALFFGGMLVYRWFREKKISWLDFGFAALSSVLGFAWLLIAWAVTGRPDAYVKTELAWRAGYTDASGLVPFSGWFESGRFHLGEGFGQVVAALLMLIFGAILFLPSVKRLGVELRIWVASYLVYLFAVFFPQSSTPRILFPAFPLLLAFGIATSGLGRVPKVLILALSLLGQVGWLLLCWKYTAPDYTPP
ncbi:MAG: hypothetical protein ACKOWR_05750 [Micrococcales bacterium]